MRYYFVTDPFVQAHPTRKMTICLITFLSRQASLPCFLSFIWLRSCIEDPRGQITVTEGVVIIIFTLICPHDRPPPPPFFKI